ncbi:MAG: hypothetical protein L3J49_15185, partial [Desulfobulbaceae bacterium]|nr:hypothetical protein [Desulfobulbaceae bacterium]
TKRDSVYTRPLQVTTSFGKLPATGEYGIFVNITLRAEQGERSNDTLFYRLPGGILREDALLYTMSKTKKIILAKKRWLGWKPADTVEIRYRITRERPSYSTFKVWIDVK